MPRQTAIATPKEVQFVRNNMDSLSLKEIGAIIDKSINDVFRIQKYIRDGRYEDIDPPKPEPLPQKTVRPPAIYTNRSHEEVINYWMHYPI